MMMTRASGDYSSLLHDIQAFGTELTGHVNRFVAKIPAEHRGEKYRRSIVNFAWRVNRLEQKSRKRIHRMANRITALHHNRNWETHQDVVTLWHELAVALTNFSEHPTEKVATLIISPDNRLQSYGVNRMPPGIVKRAFYYLTGIRKGYVVCSERMALANFFKLTIPAWRWRGKPLKKEERDEMIKNRVASFSEEILQVGAHSTELRGSIMLSTVVPCDICVETIAACRPAKVLVDDRTGKSFTRDVGFEHARTKLRRAGVSLVRMG